MEPVRLTPGDPAPWFIAPSLRNSRYHFDSVAGRYVALCFYGSAANPATGQMLAEIRAAADVFQDDHASFFGVSADPDDERQARIEERIPGFRLLWDYGLKVAARYGVCAEPEPGGAARYQPTSFILDPAGVIDYGRKRRRDYLIGDAALWQAIRDRIERRLVPELRKAFQFRAGFIERYIVACYDAGEGGYFRPHRDNTTKGTAHRRFAVTINLNAEDYEGGDLCFPEFGRETYRAPSGGSIVFSCSLMHEALPVTRGRRYCVLPFLYDEAGARVREANLAEVPDDRLRDEVKASMPGAAAVAVDPPAR